MAESPESPAGLRFAVDENPPHLMSALLGLQIVCLIIGGIALTPIIVLQATGNMQFATWVVFAAFMVSGATTVLQARPIGPFGAGYSLFMGTSGAFVAVSMAAVEAGGLPLLATLVVVSSLFQFLLSTRLGALRRIVTPTVGGTVVMLIAVAIFPIAFSLLEKTPSHFTGPDHIAPLVATTTFVIIVGICLFGAGQLRLWGPLIGLVAGWVLAYFTGLINLDVVQAAAWVGLPSVAWPGFDLSFSTAFWLLLPGFIICTIVGALETFGDGLAIQELSRRRPGPPDFKVVQGAVNADGIGNLLSGLAGTLPNTTYSTSLSVVELTGVASRRVGAYGGAILLALAFCPKLSALLQTVPPPVTGPFLVVLLVLLFAHGMRLVVSEGFGYEEGILMGLAFWLGTGFQGQAVFSSHMPEWAHRLLDNGMTTGGLVALLVSVMLSIKRPAMKKLRVEPLPASLATVREFLDKDPVVARLAPAPRNRLDLAVEEAFVYLVDKLAGEVPVDGAPVPAAAPAPGASGRKIEVLYRARPGEVEVEFVSAPGDENVESALAALQGTPAGTVHDARLRILNSVADELRHMQFHGADYLLIKIRCPLPERGIPA